jgi:methyl-accepting chemotaxis protein
MTQEIAHNVGQAAQGTADVASNITNVNVGAVATGSASTQCYRQPGHSPQKAII